LFSYDKVKVLGFQLKELVDIKRQGLPFFEEAFVQI
jgi:hypothetical protein